MKLAGRYVKTPSGLLLQIHVVCAVNGLKQALCRYRHEDKRMRSIILPIHILTPEKTQ